MHEIISEIENEIETLSKIILSNPAEKDPSLPEKISVQKKMKKSGEASFLSEERRGPKAFHQNLSKASLSSYIEEKLSECAFRQIGLFTEEKEISFRISKKGKLLRLVNTKNKTAIKAPAHNREKNYLIREGDPVPFLVDLGIFTKDFRPVASKYDKFRQINRFVEIIDHSFSSFEKDEISILDFGCGKSYLTFLIYYYFSVLKKKKVHITGYDLKEDVVANCNALAKKYGYHGLEFVVADVTRDAFSAGKIDFVISLHACDIATDFALNFALEKKVPYIFSVPCCQHEICSQIKKGEGEMDLFLDHGLFKERFSALITDAIRTKVLEAEGYRVDVLEFVDFSHSPKNMMLRAKKVQGKKRPDLTSIEKLEKKYGFSQTLYHLRKGK